MDTHTHTWTHPHTHARTHARWSPPAGNQQVVRGRNGPEPGRGDPAQGVAHRHPGHRLRDDEGVTHTHTHTHTHTRTHTHTHTHTSTCVQCTHRHLCTHTHVLVGIQMHTSPKALHTHNTTHINTCCCKGHTNSCALAHMLAHKCMYSMMSTRTQFLRDHPRTHTPRACRCYW